MIKITEKQIKELSLSLNAYQTQLDCDTYLLMLEHLKLFEKLKLLNYDCQYNDYCNRINSFIDAIYILHPNTASINIIPIACSINNKGIKNGSIDKMILYDENKKTLGEMFWSFPGVEQGH